MALREFKLPDPGEGLTEAEIVTWHVKAGDTVKVNDVIVEVETAKSLVELPVPFAGTVSALHVAEGDTVEVGTSIIAIDDGASSAETPPPAEDVEEGLIGGTTSTGRTAVLVGYGVKQTEAKRRPRTGSGPTKVDAPESPARGSDVAVEPSELTGEQARALAKPPVRKLAKDLGVDLGSVSPTGEGGVVTREDVESAASGGSGEVRAVVTPSGETYVGSRDGERETRVPVKGVRRMTAQAMVSSAFTAPHVTEWVTVDVTATMDLVERLKKDPEFRDVKVTPLLVLAKAIGTLTTTAREGRTQPADMSGGTLTITNVGVFGIDAGTPILNPGESAIMAFGTVGRRPWVVTGPDGSEAIEVRWVTTLALSFDHRLVDGELGSRYLADVAALLADPSRALVWG